MSAWFCMVKKIKKILRNKLTKSTHKGKGLMCDMYTLAYGLNK